jgi:Zn-dependent protease
MMEFSIAQKIAIWALPVLFAITLHEAAHAWVAWKFGDQTARLSGRLTINPLKHIDLVGTILVPSIFLIIMFFNPGMNFLLGWAKPVPIDPRNMKNPRKGMAFTAAAGPGANFLMAFVWAALVKLGLTILHQNPWFAVPLIYMGEAGIMINLVLGVWNCLPIPPLDGGKILMNLLPPRMAWYFLRVEPYSLPIIILLIYTGTLSMLISPPVTLLSRLISHLFGLAVAGIP